MGRLKFPCRPRSREKNFLLHRNFSFHTSINLTPLRCSLVSVSHQRINLPVSSVALETGKARLKEPTDGPCSSSGGCAGVRTDPSVSQRRTRGRKSFFNENNKKFLYLRYLMAIKAFHRTGLARESRGSSLMKSCRTNKKVASFREEQGAFPDPAATTLEPGLPAARNRAEISSSGLESFTRF